MKRSPLKPSQKPLTRKTPLRPRKPLKSASTKRTRKTIEQKTGRELIKAVDELFSKYIRLRDSEYDGNGWYGTCITCSKTGQVAWIDETGKLRFVSGWDNGHFIGRSVFATRFDELNCNLQCSFRCNKMRSGEHEKYKRALEDKYGKGTYRSLAKIARDDPNHKFTKEELLQIAEDSKTYIAYMLSNTDKYSIIK